MDFLKISAVSYLNTFPFVFGLQKSGLLHNFSLELDVPSVCAQKLKDGRVDIALVPVAALPELKEYRYISDYCIGAVGDVKTVLLLSRVPLEHITRVHLDFDSRTSVELVKVLASHWWKIRPQWVDLRAGEASSPRDIESLVAIGDKTFQIRHDFRYSYDLAREWIDFSGLPFVFAAWVSTTKLDDQFLQQFSLALKYGIDHKRECLDYFREKLPAYDDCLGYLENSISYDFDDAKKKGLELFLKLLQQQS
jgi:chorismate dehydratase